jgi:cysteine desulfurase
MLANNETGVLQPAAEIAALCRARGVPYHCDAVCVIGKLQVDLPSLGCDLLSLSGHKLYAPKGFGVLVRRPGLALRPRILGCGQQNDLRSGTEDAAGAAAFARSLERLAEGAYRAAADPSLRDELWRGLRERFPAARLNGAGERLANTLSVAFPGARAQTLQAELALRGFSVGVGASGGRGTASHVLVAMGLAQLATLLHALAECLPAQAPVPGPR